MNKYTKQLLNSNWEFQEEGTEKWMPASVPGCVHTDLINNDKIVDPFIGINEIAGTD